MGTLKFTEVAPPAATTGEVNEPMRPVAPEAVTVTLVELLGSGLVMVIPTEAVPAFSAIELLAEVKAAVVLVLAA